MPEVKKCCSVCNQFTWYFSSFRRSTDIFKW